MVEVDIYEFNGKEYCLLEEQEIKGEKYLFFSNVNDDNDILFRKVDKNDPEYLLPLDNENEVKMAALIFMNDVLDDKK